jgi:hypothetical protein
MTAAISEPTETRFFRVIDIAKLRAVPCKVIERIPVREFRIRICEQISTAIREAARGRKGERELVELLPRHPDVK